jgi:hypothetical protein
LGHPTSDKLASVAAATVLAMTGLVSRSAHARSLKLLVFLHVPLKQRAFEGQLQAALPSLEVKAVGRLADFERALADGTDAVLSLPPLLASRGLTLKLQGQRSGSSEERYALVGSVLVPDPTRVSAVGALDLFGRDATNNFVFGLLGARPKIERVTKFEDLLPLLQMQKVEAILLPSRLLPEVKAASRLALAQRELATLVKLPAVAAVGAGGNDAAAAVARLPGKVSRTFGVDEWR